MTPTPSTFDLALVWLIAGWAVVALGAVLLAWALFRDRSRGRRRCPKCWYDMKGVPGLRCPECGRDARNDRALFRTRRRWGLAVVAVLLALAGFVGTRVPRAMKGSWFAEVPVVAMRPFLWMQRERAQALYDSGLPIPSIVSASGTRARFGEEWTRLLIASELNRRLLKEQVPGREVELLRNVQELGAEARPAVDGVRTWLRKDCQIAIHTAAAISHQRSIDLTADLLRVVRKSSLPDNRQIAALEAFRVGLARGRLVPSLSPEALRDVGAGTVRQAVALCHIDSKQVAGRRFVLAVLASPNPEIRAAAYPTHYHPPVRFGAWAEPALEKAWNNPVINNERALLCLAARIPELPQQKWFPRLMVEIERACSEQRRDLLEQLSSHVLSDAYVEGQIAEWLAEVDRQSPLAGGRTRELWMWVGDQCSRHFPGSGPTTAHFVRRAVPLEHRANAVRHIVYHAQDLAMARAVVSIVGPTCDAEHVCGLAQTLLDDERIAWVHATTIGTLGVKFADRACMRPVIVRALESSSLDVQLNACLAAAVLPTSDPETMGRLEQLARSEVAGLARVAKRALDQLSSRVSIEYGKE
ncbi:MAG: hypothetical protein KF869_11580 [Phycisphaeraceae bacterium]|nr:hypothetical protein [Phycisphaeraceae bacterium]